MDVQEADELEHELELGGRGSILRQQIWQRVQNRLHQPFDVESVPFGCLRLAASLLS